MRMGKTPNEAAAASSQQPEQLGARGVRPSRSRRCEQQQSTAAGVLPFSLAEVSVLPAWTLLVSSGAVRAPLSAQQPARQQRAGPT